MIWFYLFTAIILTDASKPAITLAYPFTSSQECNQAGEVFSAHVKADDKIKQAGWFCSPVDFDKIDPVPDSPATPSKRGPGKNEA